MKRSAFSRKQPERQPRPPLKLGQQAQGCRMWDGKDSARVEVPKLVYVRDERLRDMCRGMACQHCGAAGPGAGVTWAHSNWAEHGKGKSIKASDEFVAALCAICHALLDQGRKWAPHVKRAIWDAAHAATVRLGVQSGTWPADVPVPSVTLA